VQVMTLEASPCVQSVVKSIVAVAVKSIAAAANGPGIVFSV
jgi:hypothetical protein